jgi:hypothetical protein
MLLHWTLLGWKVYSLYMKCYIVWWIKIWYKCIHFKSLNIYTWLRNYWFLTRVTGTVWRCIISLLQSNINFKFDCQFNTCAILYFNFVLLLCFCCYKAVNCLSEKYEVLNLYKYQHKNINTNAVGSRFVPTRLHDCTFNMAVILIKKLFCNALGNYLLGYLTA